MSDRRVKSSQILWNKQNECQKTAQKMDKTIINVLNWRLKTNAILKRKQIQTNG